MTGSAIPPPHTPSDLLHPDADNDVVSVIIPTVRRPHLVLRALASVLEQTHRRLEAIVIIDGPDGPTRDALAAIADPRLVVLHNPVPLGAGPARNRAAATARGAWLAFLDDDDEWRPDKLERQLAGLTPADRVLVSCRCEVRTPRAIYTWPRDLCGQGQELDDYLFTRRSWLRGGAYLATPTVLLPAWLFAAAGGFGATAQNEDTTLLLRATKIEGAALRMLPDTLVIIHTEEARSSLGSVFDWRASLAWLDGMGALFGRRAYSGFCLVRLGSQAALHGDTAAIPVLLRAAWRRGAPTFRQLALFAAFWAVSAGIRQRIRALRARLSW